MNSETIIVSAIVGIFTSVITAYVTARLKIKEEKEKWRREFAVKFAEAQATDNLREQSADNSGVQTPDNLRAQQIAIQFAVGVLIKNPDKEERERIFVPSNCRLTIGRAETNSISINDRRLSRHTGAFNADDENVYVEEFGATNGVFVNDEPIRGRRKLRTEDVVNFGETKFKYLKLKN